MKRLLTSIHEEKRFDNAQNYLFEKSLKVVMELMIF